MTSVLKVALYDNQKSNPVSVGCTNLGIFWDCCTAFQSNSSERSAPLLTSGFLVNQPILTPSAGRAKGGGGPSLKPFSLFFIVNPEGRNNSFPVEYLMYYLLVMSRKPRPTGPFEIFSLIRMYKGCIFTVTEIFIETTKK